MHSFRKEWLQGLTQRRNTYNPSLRSHIHMLLLISLCLSHCMGVDISYHVCSSTLQSMECSSVPKRSSLWGGGSEGDPLSVMGRGHTMGPLCQICWGCTAVGKGPALITMSMFTRVCHVWKLIRPLTFSSHKHRRISITSLKHITWNKKKNNNANK